MISTAAAIAFLVAWVPSSMTFSTPNESNVQRAAYDLSTVFNAFDITGTTSTTAEYVEALQSMEKASSDKIVGVFREQTLLVSKGKPIFFGTKFKALDQYGVASLSQEISVYTPMCTVSSPINFSERFTIDESSMALVNYVIARVAQTKEQYKIYQVFLKKMEEDVEFKFKTPKP